MPAKRCPDKTRAPSALPHRPARRPVFSRKEPPLGKSGFSQELGRGEPHRGCACRSDDAPALGEASGQADSRPRVGWVRSQDQPPPLHLLGPCFWGENDGGASGISDEKNGRWGDKRPGGDTLYSGVAGGRKSLRSVNVSGSPTAAVCHLLQKGPSWRKQPEPQPISPARGWACLGLRWEGWPSSAPLHQIRDVCSAGLFPFPLEAGPRLSALVIWETLLGGTGNPSFLPLSHVLKMEVSPSEPRRGWPSLLRPG